MTRFNNITFSVLVYLILFISEQRFSWFWFEGFQETIFFRSTVIF